MKNKSLCLMFLVLLFFSQSTYAAFPIKNADIFTTSSTHTVASPINTQLTHRQKVASVLNNITHPDRHRKYSADNNTNAILSLIFGILGVFIIFFGIPALILGIRSADKRNKYYGLAMAGLIMGAIETALLALGLFILIIFLFAIVL